MRKLDTRECCGLPRTNVPEGYQRYRTRQPHHQPLHSFTFPTWKARSHRSNASSKSWAVVLCWLAGGVVTAAARPSCTASHAAAAVVAAAVIPLTASHVPSHIFSLLLIYLSHDDFFLACFRVVF